MLRVAAAVAASAVVLPALPAAADSPGIYWDCGSAVSKPATIDLNCLHADAIAARLSWKGSRATGFFAYPACTSSGCDTVAIRARFRFSRPVTTSAGYVYTVMRVRLLANKYHRHGLSRVRRYVLTCDVGQGWIPKRLADPC
ncbi:MAG: hypothetical protein R2720_12870 [Candidatus Nanopelagicales bacterium]